MPPGALGKNVTTVGLDLLALSAGTELLLGHEAAIRITGLRNPCHQIEAFQPGLLAHVLGRTPQGALIRKAGVMGIVLKAGRVKAGDLITIVHTPGMPQALRPI